MARLGDFEFVIVRFQDTILIRKGCLSEPRLFLHHRWEVEGSDSGWYIGMEGEEPDDRPENFEKIYAYQLLDSRPELLSVLVLPLNYIALFDGDEIEGILDENDMDVWNVES